MRGIVAAMQHILRPIGTNTLIEVFLPCGIASGQIFRAVRSGLNVILYVQAGDRLTVVKCFLGKTHTVTSFAAFAGRSVLRLTPVRFYALGKLVGRLRTAPPALPHAGLTRRRRGIGSIFTIPLGIVSGLLLSGIRFFFFPPELFHLSPFLLLAQKVGFARVDE